MSSSPSPSPPPSTDEPDGATSSLLEQMLESTPAKRHEPPVGPLLGEVLDTHNPYLVGRVSVRWDEGTGPLEAWLRVVDGVRIRAGAQVLLTRPANANEWLVTASLGSARTQPRDQTVPAFEDPHTREPERIRLEPGQALRIEDHRGQSIVEIRGSESGPELRLLGHDCTFAAEGTLRIEAEKVELRGRDGVDLRSEDDVILRGRVIRLN